MFSCEIWEIFKNIQDKVFKSGPSKVCGRQPLKNFKWYGRPIYFEERTSSLVFSGATNEIDCTKNEVFH